MNIKAEAFKDIASFIHKEYVNIQNKIRSNKYSIKNLAREQAKLKRQLSEMQNLENYCYKKIENPNK